MALFILLLICNIFDSTVATEHECTGEVLDEIRFLDFSSFSPLRSVETASILCNVLFGQELEGADRRDWWLRYAGSATPIVTSDAMDEVSSPHFRKEACCSYFLCVL